MTLELSDEQLAKLGMLADLLGELEAAVGTPEFEAVFEDLP